MALSFVQKLETVVEKAASEVDSIVPEILAVVGLVDPPLVPLVQALATLAAKIEEIDQKLLALNPVPASK